MSKRIFVLFGSSIIFAAYQEIGFSAALNELRYHGTLRCRKTADEREHVHRISELLQQRKNGRTAQNKSLTAKRAFQHEIRALGSDDRKARQPYFSVREWLPGWAVRLSFRA
jgi:hypothetical protein